MRTQLLVLCLAVLPASAQSPNPKPSTEKGKGHISNEKEKRGDLQAPPHARTEGAPVPSQLNAPNGNPDPGNHDGKRKDGTDPDWWMIALTGGLVIVGVAQAYILWRQTGIINQTLILTDRPKLIVRNLAISEPSQSSRINREPSEKPFRPEEKITGALWVVNPGNGDAHFQRGWCGVYNGQGLPMEVPYDSRVGFSPLNGSTIRPGERVELRFTGTGPSDDQVAAANAAPVQRRIGGNDPAPIPLDLYVLGWIDYRDDLGITRRTAFCRRYERTRDRFIAVKDRDYEYAD